VLEKIGVIGLGYVGLPLFVCLANCFDSVTGFDIDPKRVNDLCAGHDWTGEISGDRLASFGGSFTNDPRKLDECTLFIVTVPTPIDSAKRPDLGPIHGACRTIGESLARRKKRKESLLPLIVFESTVYPGLTEEMCGPSIAAASGLRQGTDFKLGYSPERINPGDQSHRLENIVKVISAEDERSLARLENVYGKVVKAGIHKASSIKVAEAAKVIENTQRDLNIALMNEIAIICDRLNIKTRDVLAAAGTKWNFLNFTPGFVGGHCIGVDPYYLTTRAEQMGYHPQVILAGRRINDNMPVFVAQKIMKFFAEKNHISGNIRVGILGLTFKENVRDLRNSRVPELVRELRAFGVDVAVYDPLADNHQAVDEYGIELCARSSMTNLDAVILTVPHKVFIEDSADILRMIKPTGCMIDIKSALDAKSMPEGISYWSL